MSIAGEAWELLSDWLPGNHEPERPQLQLATVTDEGTPDVHTVLLTRFSPEGFWFNTDSRSRKAQQLRSTPAVALLFLWPGFTRQLSVQGVASVVPTSESAEAYQRRSPYLQQLAWQNTNAFAQLPASEREARWDAFTHSGDLSQPPPTWAGYLVRPERLTFWEGNPAAASRRTEFTWCAGEWRRTYLAG
ncbi:pyridoxine/pyridoxamine 5'-phosphate oxidase [Kineosporia sp. NBRC 101677]|uniref:pyridoxamine 5'-phosphate oxidase family protein n=1 Tax=Kineosporia sp. NBRC 101677 TaxID=3032197 RepID=UPI0024A123D7|nr:pyridoxamine 5'-phosphate oxidase family protein [Kineosporia sp. NBRC 101677]GLY16990.1 pyridoxine/pyridoxamine 5'-phosphate oxidase [Kineosporia sp. NBRC 101677]